MTERDAKDERDESQQRHDRYKNRDPQARPNGNAWFWPYKDIGLRVWDGLEVRDFLGADHDNFRMHTLMYLPGDMFSA